MDNREMLAVADVASVRRLTEETVRVWPRTREFHGYNLGGRTGRRISSTEIQRFLAEKGALERPARQGY